MVVWGRQGVPRVMISIVIPTYNARSKLVKLLRSLRDQPFRDCETIIVDDGSTEDLFFLRREFEVRVVRTGKRGGPARARNIGARQAEGDIVLFLDADVAVEPGTLSAVDRFFRLYPERSVLIGVYAPEPLNDGILPWYKALQCYSYYRDLPHISRVSLLWGAKAAFRRDVFLESGGFDESFDTPSMEDLELGRRISKKHTIFLDRDVIVRHHFPESFRKNAYDHFYRGYLWMRIFFRFGKFDNYLHTPRRGIGRIAASLVIPALAVMPFYPVTGWVAAAGLLTYIVCNYDLWSVVLERKPRILLPVLGIDFALGVILGAAAFRATGEEIFRRISAIFRSRRNVLLPMDQGESGHLDSRSESR